MKYGSNIVIQSHIQMYNYHDAAVCSIVDYAADIMKEARHIITLYGQCLKDSIQ